MKKQVMIASAALALTVGAIVLWFGSAPNVAAVTCSGLSAKIAVPDLGNLPQDQLNVSTGKIGTVDVPNCGDYTFAGARFGVATGNGSESYAKQYWDLSTGTNNGNTCNPASQICNGMKFNCFSRSGGSDSCVVDSVTYYVYTVQVP